MIYVDPLIKNDYDKLLNQDKLFRVNLSNRLFELKHSFLKNKSFELKIETYDNGVVILYLEMIKNDLFITNLKFENFHTN